MSGQLRLLLIIGIVITTLGALFATERTGNAAGYEGHWSMYERQGASSFAAGGVAFAATPEAPELPGYEIVGLDAVGVSESLAGYQYWGLAADPPQTPIVSCDSVVAPPVMSLSIRGAYPYAGCVFFLGVTNAGDADLRVELGTPGDSLPVACSGGPCQSSDVDALAGGQTQAEIAERCSISGAGPGGVVPADATSLIYLISPGYTFVCPFFVVILQPACENCDYAFIITPGPTEQAQEPEPEEPEPEPPAPEIPQVPEIQVAPSATPTPAQAATSTPDSESPTPGASATPTATATPIDETAGVRTPGVPTATSTGTVTTTPSPTPRPGTSSTAIATPRPPSAGNGVLVRRGSEAPNSIVTIVIVALATVLCLAIAWPAGRHHAAGSYPFDELAGGPGPARPALAEREERGSGLSGRIARIRARRRRP